MMLMKKTKRCTQFRHFCVFFMEMDHNHNKTLWVYVGNLTVIPRLTFTAHNLFLILKWALVSQEPLKKLFQWTKKSYQMSILHRNKLCLFLVFSLVVRVHSVCECVCFMLYVPGYFMSVSAWSCRSWRITTNLCNRRWRDWLPWYWMWIMWKCVMQDSLIS